MLNNDNAVSVVPNDGGIDEFPVLKAFQQYIDAEQNKARKRMMMLTAIFALFMMLVVAVFVILLFNVSQRNQALNDRLVDFAMQQQNRPAGSAVVVQPPADNTALLQLTAKLEEMRKNFEAEKSAREAQQVETEKAKAEAAKQPNPQDLEIMRLKNLLQIEKDKLKAEQEKVSAEKAKVAAEKARQHELELEAYRRKHYPELYEPKPQIKATPKTISAKTKPAVKADADLDEVDEILKDIDSKSLDKPISYFDYDEDADEPVAKPKKKAESVKKTTADEDYVIPVETIKSTPTSRWRIPNN